MGRGNIKSPPTENINRDANIKPKPIANDCTKELKLFVEEDNVGFVTFLGNSDAAWFPPLYFDNTGRFAVFDVASANVRTARGRFDTDFCMAPMHIGAATRQQRYGQNQS